MGQYEAPTRPSNWIVSSLLGCGILAWTGAAGAIDTRPEPARIQAALERGKAAAAARIPPNQLYAWFGGKNELEPRGFVMTKMAGLAVMATHFALRSETPAEADIRQILDEQAMLISVTIYGGHPAFARDSYMVLTQGGHTIKPAKVRFDGQANRTSVWPKMPAYHAKVVASFPYGEFDPRARTRISVFPSAGGEVAFDVDFSQVE